MSRSSHPAVTPPLIFGLLLMLLGSLLTLDRFDVIDAGGLLRFWPIVPIGAGALLLTQRRDAGGRFWGGFWLLVGIWLLLRTLGIVRVGLFEMLLPTLLLLVGFRLIVHAIRPDASDAVEQQGDASLVAILSESKRTSLDNPFRGGNMTAFMGGCQFDLRQAAIPPGGTAVIDVYGLMSGHEIWVPPGWTVETNVVPIMAGVEDKRLPVVPQGQPSSLEPAPRLLLRGYIVMSGLTIKS
jgi:hypothetical protein